MSKSTSQLKNVPKKTKSSNKLPNLRQIKTLNAYNFIDLGAGDGASLVNIERIIGGNGVGVELSTKKVQKAFELKRNVYQGNALDLHKIPGKVDFVTCDNFLEHLLTFEDVYSMLEQASKVARKFIYVRHPSFENVDYLKSLGLRTYWSHWHGHTAHVTIKDFVEMFNRLGIYDVKVVPVCKIKDSTDDKILPVGAPIDQHDYDEQMHGKKPKVKFDRDLYYAFDIIAMLPGNENQTPKLLYKDRLTKTSHPFFSDYELEIKDIQKQVRKLQREIDGFRATIAYRVHTRFKRVLGR
ncbi:class I SAM-dependent methyltransferase [Candidatus Saccharibacteria bacterium]|nr:class I SAM-dependent methyltransferase [Candidatus Saccharibacteria bacterium]